MTSADDIAAVTVLAGMTFFVFAQLARWRALTRRGANVRTSGGLAQLIAYFLWVPYVVVIVRPGPELAIPDPLRALGLGLVVGGVAFSLWAVATLGRHYDLVIEIHSDHQLVRGGPYRWARHPVYTGLIVHFLGACLATGNLLLVAGTLLVTIPAFLLRARTEEALLRERFGAEYDRYAKQVGMLAPFL
jgi:protein-S-isoprenylcysteine O-methyltransferase Ste14